jgi:hypothetical protein
MNKKDFLPFLENALGELISKEDKIIERKLYEVCINHKFANYLNNEVKKSNNFNWLEVDLEYDKNYDKKKEIFTVKGKEPIRPDILIHKRKDNYNNMVAIECKKNYMNKKDKTKLLKLLHDPFNYCLTCWLSYLPGEKHMLIKLFETNRIYIYYFNKNTKKLKLKKEVDYDQNYIS